MSSFSMHKSINSAFSTSSQGNSRTEIPLQREDTLSTLDKVLTELIEPTTYHDWQVPVDAQMEVELAKLTTLISQGDYAGALARANTINITDRLHPTIATAYRALLAQKVSLIHLRIAQAQHYTSDQVGKNDVNVGYTPALLGAKTAAEHYQKAIDSLIQACPDLSVVVEGYKKTFTALQHRRAAIIKQIISLARDSVSNASNMNGSKLMPSEPASSASAAYLADDVAIPSSETTETNLTTAGSDFGEFSGKTIPQLVDLLNATAMVSTAEFTSRFNVDIKVPADRAVAPSVVPSVFTTAPLVTASSMSSTSYAESGMAQEVELATPSPIPGVPFKTMPVQASNTVSAYPSSYPSSSMEQSTLSLSSSVIMGSSTPGKQTRGAEKVTPRVPALGMNGLPSSLVLPIVAQLQQILTCQYAFNNGLDPMGSSYKMLPLQKPKKLKETAKRTLEYVSEIDKKIVLLQRHVEDVQTLQGAMERHSKWCRGENMATTTQLQDLVQLVQTTACNLQQLQTVVESFNKVERPVWTEVAMATLGVIDNYRCKEFAACFAPGQDSSKVMETKPTAYMTGSMAAKLTKGKTSAGTVMLDTQLPDRLCNKLKRETELLSRSLNELIYVLLAQLAQRDFQQVGFAGCDFFTTLLTHKLVASEVVSQISPRQYRTIINSLVDQREVLLKRAIFMGHKLEMIYNLRHDAPVSSMKMNYFDSPHDVNEFTASARVYRDLVEIDVDKACRLRGTRFAQHDFSLCNDRALAFAALRGTGTAIFHTEMADFDHAHPGAYMQTIENVIVKVYSTQGKEIKVCGRIVNLGSSERRVMIPRAEVNSFRGLSTDPSPAIAAIGFGRQWIHGHPDVVTLPVFDKFVGSERRPFQGIGLETSWKLELKSDFDWSVQDIGDVVLTFQYRYCASEPLAQIINQLKREIVVFTSPKNSSMLDNGEGTITTPTLEAAGIKAVGLVTTQRVLLPRLTQQGTNRVVGCVVPTKLDKVNVRPIDVPLSMNSDVDTTEMHNRRTAVGEPFVLNVVNQTASKRWSQVELVNAQIPGKALEWLVEPAEEFDAWLVLHCMVAPNTKVIF
jgi:hypothetical protein